MPSRPNPTSRASRGSSPHLAFDVRPCRRAQLVWMLFGLVVAVALGFGVWHEAPWSLITAPGAGGVAGGPAFGLALAVTVAIGLAGLTGLAGLAGLPALATLAGRGPLAVRRFEWLPDGTWLLTRLDGQPESGRLTGATATLGPWILLAWTVGG